MNQETQMAMDMRDFSYSEGNVEVISSGKEEDYYTFIEMFLPNRFLGMSEGTFNIEHRGIRVELTFNIIRRPEDDPILNANYGISFGSGNGMETIPFGAFTDNKGSYPAMLTRLVFPKRLASWLKVKNKIDFERLQIIGPQDLNEEKISALIIINKYIQSINLDASNVLYDEITVFLEKYSKKPSRTSLFKRTNALTTKVAYRTALHKYFGKDIEDSIDHFKQNSTNSVILTERDLKTEVLRFIDDCLLHHIENRRWVEAFWNDEQKIDISEGKAILPRYPKKEVGIQTSLYTLMHMTLAPQGINVARESNEGIGIPDFVFTYTTKERNLISVALEFKCAHHSGLKKGISNQLPAYSKSIKSRSGIFLDSVVTSH